MRIAIITGSRDWPSPGDIARDLNEFKPDIVVHGHCPNGADFFAEKWSVANKVHIVRFSPNWRLNGRAAGPLRNTKMIVYGKDLQDEGNTVKVFAYRLNESRGTTDCIRQARMHGLNVKIMEMHSRNASP